MDSIDRALFDEHARLCADPAARAKHAASLAGSTYTRPVRSWCLSLRADDKRLETVSLARIVRYHDWGDEQSLCAVLEFTLCAHGVRALCAPVMIPWPGVSIDAAAATFGVNRTTIHRWARKGRVRLEIDAPSDATFVHRAPKRVWTPSAVDPSGDVWRWPWGDSVRDLTRRVPDQWSQTVERTHRLLRPGVYVRMLACPLCGRRSSKLLWPQAVWTVSAYLRKSTDDSGEQSAAEASEPGGLAAPRSGESRVEQRFVCYRCARVVYESAERGSRPGRGRTVDGWGRFLKRAVGDVGG